MSSRFEFYYARVSENLKLLSDFGTHIIVSGIECGEMRLEKICII